MSTNIMVEKIAPTIAQPLGSSIYEYVSQNPGSSLAQISRELCIPKGSLHPSPARLLSANTYTIKAVKRAIPAKPFIYGNKHVSDSDLLERIRSVMLRINEITHETLLLWRTRWPRCPYLIKMDTSRFRVISIRNKLPPLHGW